MSLIEKLEALEKNATPGPYVDGPVDFISGKDNEPILQIVLDDDGNRALVLGLLQALPQILALLKAAEELAKAGRFLGEAWEADNCGAADAAATKIRDALRTWDESKKGDQ